MGESSGPGSTAPAVKALEAGDFVAIVKLVCPHCRVGHRAVERADTKEWVHNRSVTTVTGVGAGFSHTLCWADGLRRSAYAPAGVVV